MTMRGRALWQAASAPLHQAAPTETRTMTTSMTGDHVFRNWPTCMANVKVGSKPQEEDLSNSPPVKDTDHPTSIFLDIKDLSP